VIKKLLLLSIVAIFVNACENSSAVSPSSALTLASVLPTSGPVGTSVIITGTGFAAAGAATLNTVNFGSSAYPNVTSGSGTTIAFSIPTTTNPPCRNVMPPCEIVSALITPGTYDISVTNSDGTSNSISFTVTAS
jgi:hypothetical protein